MKTYKNKYILPVLAAALYCMTAAGFGQKDSTITLPWNEQRTYYQTTGSYLSIKGSSLDGKMMGDLRNRLTGLITGLDVTELAGGFEASGYAMYTMNTNKLAMKMRGCSNLMCIVNDMYIPFSQLLLDPNQIESITVLSDVADRAKYGPLASDGALLIRTKQGGYNTPMRITVDMESGVSFAGRVSEWVNGVDYARMNNDARAVSGYDVLFAPEAISGFGKNDPYDMQYPNVDYKSLMYKNSYPISRAGVSFYGGGNSVKYSFALNGLYSGDLVKGGSQSDFSKFTISTGLAAKIGRYIEVGVDFSTLLSFNRYTRVDWNSYRIVPAVSFPLTMGTVESGSAEGDEGLLGTTIYGVSRTFPDNYYALLKEGGFRTERLRTGLLNASVNVDLSWLLKGLKSRTWLSTSNFVQTTVGKNNDYLAFYWERTTGKDLISTHKGSKASGKVMLSQYTVQGLGFYERLSYDRLFGKHNVSAGATFALNNTSNKSTSYNQRQLYSVFDASYSYADKYIVELVGQYAGSFRFNKAHRYVFLPSAGLAWVASNENFLKNANWLDNLKIHGQAGLIGQSGLFGQPYLYQGDYSFANGMWYGALTDQNVWFGDQRWVAQTTTMNRMPNKNLGWPKIFQADAGIDWDFLGVLSFRANAYYRRTEGTIANISSAVPGVFGIKDVELYDNYTSNSARGIDFSLDYNQSFGDFRVMAGVSTSTWEIKYEKIVNDDYLYDYQKKTGTPTDSYWGFRCIGKYTDPSQLTSLPAYSVDAQVGDLIYEDVNNDGLVDENDRVNLGHTSPRLRYAVRLGFAWKNLEINAVGTGNAFYKTAMTNEYFWNGWGDGNYSAFVRDNLGGAYPRLDYVQSKNNFVASDFWLRNGGWFKVQDVEIAYTLPLKKGALRSIRFSVKGQNLATVSGIKDVDPESIDAGVSSYPLMRSFSGGIKLNF